MVNMKRIFKCTGKIVVGLFGCITAMLFLFSVFETSKISISEVVSYHRDFPVIHLQKLIFFVILYYYELIIIILPLDYYHF